MYQLASITGLQSKYQHVRNWYEQLVWLKPAVLAASNGSGYKLFSDFVKEDFDFSGNAEVTIYT